MCKSILKVLVAQTAISKCPKMGECDAIGIRDGFDVQTHTNTKNMVLVVISYFKNIVGFVAYSEKMKRKSQIREEQGGKCLARLLF